MTVLLAHNTTGPKVFGILLWVRYSHRMAIQPLEYASVTDLPTRRTRRAGMAAFGTLGGCLGALCFAAGWLVGSLATCLGIGAGIGFGLLWSWGLLAAVRQQYPRTQWLAGAAVGAVLGLTLSASIAVLLAWICPDPPQRPGDHEFEFWEEAVRVLVVAAAAVIWTLASPVVGAIVAGCLPSSVVWREAGVRDPWRR